MKIRLLLLLTMLFSVVSWGQVNLSVGGTYTQNFDGLGSASATWTDNTTLLGWYVSTATLPISTGTTASGTCVNVGIAGTNPLSDRAIGCLQSGGTNQRFGLRLKNNGASDVTSYSVNFTGEQWRSFNAGTLVFEYQIATTVTSLTAGSWTAAAAFNFGSLQTSGGAAIDGNTPANRTDISSTLTVTVPVGSEIFIRWTRNTNSSPILAVDDLSITANGGCTAPSISAQPSTSTQSLCQGSAATALSVTAAGTSLTYQWYSNTTASNSGGTLIGGATSASYTPLTSTAGTLYYYCIVTGTCGTVTSNVSGDINVTALPATPSAPTAVANPSCGSTTLNAMTAPGGETYYWQGTTSNGTSTASNANAAYTVPSSGTYYVRSRNNTTLCWSAQSSIVMTINTAPTVPTTGNPTAACEGSAVTFTGTGSTGATSYTFWDAASGGTKYLNGVGGYTITATALTTPTALTAGTYTYYVQGETAACVSATRKSVTVTINAIPANPAGTISASANPSCGAATLTYSAPSATLYWQTTAGGTSTSNPTTSTYNAASTGTYYVRSYNGSCWSTGTVSLAITVNAAVNITTQPANQAVVVGNTAAFSITTTGATSYQWQVSTNGGSTWSNVGTNSNSYTTAATTIGMNAYQYQVLISGAAPCTTATSTAAILTVNTAPCLSENFAVNALPSGWAQNQITFASNYAEFSNASGNGDLTTIAVSNPTSLTFALARSSNATAKDLIIEVSTTSQTTGFATVTTYNHGNTTSNSTTNCTVDLSAYTADTTVYIRFRKASGTTSYWRLDDINVYCNSTTPTITLTPATLTGMTYVFGAGPSTNQTFTASGVNLTADILLTPPTDYEISTTAGAGFGSTITLTQTAGTVNATTIYTRLKAGLAVNTYNAENIAGTSAGATTKNVVCSGSVTAPAATNNLCGSATVLTVNAAAIAGNMTGCTVSAPFSGDKDVWYSFTPTCTGIHAITVAGFTGDIDIELFAGSCPATTTTLDGSAGTTSTETISTTLTSGTTYYLRVLAYDNDAETSAFTAQVVSSSVLTLTNAGSPATGNISAGTNNAIIMGFTTTPTCATSYDITNVTLTKSGVSTAISTDISNFRIFYDTNGNGIIDGGEVSVSGAGIAIGTTMAFTLTGQTGITVARKYLLVADIAPAAVNGRTIKINLSPNTDLTSVLTPAGTKTGTALGNTQTITPPACTSAVISSITPTSGPVGTEVTITASSGSLVGATATFNGVSAAVVFSSATQLVVTVPTGAATGNLIITDGQPCNVVTTFTVINTDITSCQGAGNSFTDLIISEVYDSQAGNVWHMELFNPTNAAIDLDAVGANYRLERYATIGDAAPTRTVDISGIILPGAVYLADLGTITDPSCIKAFDYTSFAQGINELDAIKLTKENVTVDIVHCPNEKGYTITRNTNAVGPTPTFNGADWNTNSGELCTDLGLFSATLNTPPTISAQPSVSITCTSTSAALSVTAAEGFVGGNPLAYQWYVAAPGVSTWTALTNTGVYTGATSSSLNISSLTGLENYQYYCQVRENGATCYKATIAIKIPGGLSTTWNGTAWSNGTPTLGKLTIIDGNYNTTTNGDIDACSLLVNTGFTATVTADHYINIQNDLTVNGTLDVLNNGSLVQINDAGVNTGNIIMRRTANIKLQDYVYWSSPVSGFAVTSISSSTPTSLLWKWNPTVANGNGGQGNWQSASGAMTLGEGYIVRAPNGYTNASTTAFTANFSGVPSNGIYTPAISRGSDTGAGINGPNGVLRTATDDNWNLLGNPYPSAIGINSFLTANNNIDGFVRLWTHGTLPSNAISDPFYDNFVSNYTASDYVAINGAGATSGGGTLSVIGAGQGFFVLMNAGAASTSSVTFNNAMRNKTFSNSQFYKSTNLLKDNQHLAGERHRIWLDLVSPTGPTIRTLVAYVEGATEEKDRMFDALTDYKSAQNFYSLIDNEVMAIQGRSLPFSNQDIVPMGIKVPTDGTYKIAIAEADGLFQRGGQVIFLEDKLLNVIHDLTVAPYQFTASQGIINNRFVLRYTNASLGTDDFDVIENNVVVATANHEIQIKSQAESIKNIIVYDVLGRIIFEKNKINANEFTIQNMVVNQQALIVKIVLENGQTVNKKIVF